MQYKIISIPKFNVRSVFLPSCISRYNEKHGSSLWYTYSMRHLRNKGMLEFKPATFVTKVHQYTAKLSLINTLQQASTSHCYTKHVELNQYRTLFTTRYICKGY